MDARRESELTLVNNRTTVERKSERELVVTRIFNAPACSATRQPQSPWCCSVGTSK